VGGEKDGELHGEYRQKVFKAKHVHVKGEQRGWVEENDGFVVGGDQSIEIQGGRSTSVGGDDIGIAGGNLLREATGTAHIKGADIKIEASGTIELSAGGSSVVITGAGVYITGSTVYLNSGSGPSVSAVEGGVGPDAVEEPGAAAVTNPGRDVHYTDEGIEWSRTPAPSVVPGHEFESPEPENTTWIEIELVDQNGDPVPGEPFRLRDASERNFSGSLDENGFARVEGVVPGDCEIRFPNRDLTVWRRAT
jgi:type VI secretion system secreted protein VgrG